MTPEPNSPQSAPAGAKPKVPWALVEADADAPLPTITRQEMEEALDARVNAPSKPVAAAPVIKTTIATSALALAIQSALKTTEKPSSGSESTTPFDAVKAPPEPADLFKVSVDENANFQEVSAPTLETLEEAVRDAERKTASVADSESPVVVPMTAATVILSEANDLGPANEIPAPDDEAILKAFDSFDPTPAEDEDAELVGAGAGAGSGAVINPHSLHYESDANSPTSGGGWTLAVLCIGLSLIAACVLIPQADSNRRLVYEREKLRLDLEQIERQVAVNKDFLNKVDNDPQLAERLAQRQMKMIRKGTTILDLKDPNAVSSHDAAAGAERMSPFLLVHVPPPPPLPAYQPVGGLLADLCRSPRSQLYVLAGGLFLVAAGLVLGFSPKGM